ncbi:MAG: hypothetical protein ACOC9Q_00810 [bacterium]
MNALNVTGTLAKLLSTTTQATDDLSGGLQQLRTRIGELQEQIAEVENHAVSKAEALKRLGRWARGAKARGIGEMSVNEFIRPAGRARIPLTPQSPQPYVFDVLVSLLADGIHDRLAERIEAHYAGCAGITDAEREKRIQKLEGELADLEVAEERLVRTAERAGLPVLRRADASPLIVLAPDSALES